MHIICDHAFVECARVCGYTLSGGIIVDLSVGVYISLYYRVSVSMYIQVSLVPIPLPAAILKWPFASAATLN